VILELTLNPFNLILEGIVSAPKNVDFQHPLGQKSAGLLFRNSSSASAGRMIMILGLKALVSGRRRGATAMPIFVALRPCLGHGQADCIADARERVRKLRRSTGE